MTDVYADLEREVSTGSVPPPGDGDAPPAMNGQRPTGDVLDRHRGSLIDWPTFWATEHAEESWSVEPLLPRGRAVALYAPGKTGKSLLALGVAAAAATGRWVLDRLEGSPLSVVYFDLEMTEDDLHERLSDMGYGPDSDLSRFAYYLLPHLLMLDTAEGGEHVRAIAREHDADLVVIDTTSRVLAGAENDADTLRAFHRHTGQPLKADGRTVWRLDHAGKDATRGQRGTSAKNDDVDVVWELTAREGATVRLRATHRRMSWVPEIVDLVRLDGPLRYERVAESWPDGTAELVAQLDLHGVAVDASNREAARVLRDAGVPVRNEVLAAAVRRRRQGAEGGR